MGHIQTQTEWEQEISEKVLRQVQNELYMELRFLDAGLAAFEWTGVPSLTALATDGRKLYFSPSHLLHVFEHNPKFLGRCYLHITLHCVFSHLWLRGKRDAARWNLACDIAVERMIDGLDRECTRRPLSWLRASTYEELEQQEITSAAGIYTWLQSVSPDSRERLIREYYTDSHRYWPNEEQETPASAATRKMWDKISRQSRMEMEQRGMESGDGEELLRQEWRAGGARRSYREFLKKFAIFREEIHSDPDEFDLNYYTFGLGLYGNMPLIEPLESRESLKIQEFVIVVDTSYSTSGGLVKQFLNETFGILAGTDSFFHKCHIRVIQCDDEVRMDERITGRDELEALMERFTLVGGGGTDFRPAFAYVDELVRSGELRDLKGLLYFTDGKGIYPARRPEYDTAFLFMGEFDETAVPPWAMRLRLEPDEFGADGNMYSGKWR